MRLEAMSKDPALREASSEKAPKKPRVPKVSAKRRAPKPKKSPAK